MKHKIQVMAVRELNGSCNHSKFDLLIDDWIVVKHIKVIDDTDGFLKVRQGFRLGTNYIYPVVFRKFYPQIRQILIETYAKWILEGKGKRGWISEPIFLED